MITSQLRIERFSDHQVTEAVQDRALIPKRLSRFDRVQLRFGKPDRLQIVRALRVVEGDELRALGIDPYSITEVEDNIQTYTGMNNMLRLLIGTTVSAGGTNYGNGNARLLVGNGNGSVPTALITDTDLAAPTGATTRYCNACDATYPNTPNGGNNSAAAILTAQATVSSGNGNFAWNEWGMDSGGASGTGAASGLFNHKGVSLGTKSGGSWILQATFTQSSS